MEKLTIDKILSSPYFEIISTGLITIVIGVITKVISKKKKNKEEPNTNSNTNTNQVENNFSPVLTIYNIPKENVEAIQNEKEKLEHLKLTTKILFIDDDTKFKVVNILKKAGWIYTKAIKDVGNLDRQSVKEADIIFVDIQGVGYLLGCKDEGLGLALTLKKKYPRKKVIIYSAETKGDRFHEALRKADNFLAKNAEPYEFQQLVEQYSDEIKSNG